MTTPGKHKTVQARILASAEAIGCAAQPKANWAGVSNTGDADGAKDKIFAAK